MLASIFSVRGGGPFFAQAAISTEKCFPTSGAAR